MHRLGRNKLVEKERQETMKKGNIKLVISGSPASAGEATGVARIAFDPIEADRKIEDGDILITPMTNPDYTLAILKASAIVTNFGGILCHAALISRELGKPCVTGTRKATEVLKDGQEILVNGDKGEVYILQ